MYKFLDTWFQTGALILIFEILVTFQDVLKLNSLFEAIGCLFGFSIIAIHLGFITSIVIGVINIGVKVLK